MAFGKRRRQQPATTVSPTLLHYILALTGLGSANDSDAEAVTVLADRVSLATRLFDRVDDTEHHSAWLPCADRSVFRWAVEYHATPDTRVFSLGLSGHDGRVTYARLMEPENPGFTADLIAATPSFKGVLFADNELIDVRGFLAVKLIVHAKSGAPAVSTWAGVG